MSLRHHLIFDGAVMAQDSLRRHQPMPNGKVMAAGPLHHLSGDGASMAQWRTLYAPGAS